MQTIKTSKLTRKSAIQTNILIMRVPEHPARRILHFLLSYRAPQGIPRKGTILKPDRGRSKASPFPHGVSPVSVPLIAVQQGIHGKPRWAGTLSVSQSGAFSDCVTRFRGGALRHAKFPKTSYKVQLLDTLKHAACVNLNHRRRRGLIFLSSKVLVPLGKTQAFCRVMKFPRTSLPYEYTIFSGKNVFGQIYFIR